MDFSKLAEENLLEQTKNALLSKGYEVEVVDTGILALEAIKETIPDGASVMNGSSVTLETIGYPEYLKSGGHKWIDWHSKVTAEPDKEKRAQIRRESMLSDYYLGSVHALIADGDFIVASNTGSQLPHVVYSSQNLIYVVSTKKIVPSFEMGMKRLVEYVVPKEDEHMQTLYNVHTALNKIVIVKGESPMMGRHVKFILVKEDLGF